MCVCVWVCTLFSVDVCICIYGFTILRGWIPPLLRVEQYIILTDSDAHQVVEMALLRLYAVDSDEERAQVFKLLNSPSMGEFQNTVLRQMGEASERTAILHLFIFVPAITHSQFLSITKPIEVY